MDKHAPFFGQFRRFGFLFLVLTLGMFAACHPPHSKKKQQDQGPTTSLEDSLGKEFPVLEHLVVQKELLHKHSKPTKEKVVPRQEDFIGKFNSGVIELILDEIDGEPSYFYGHLEKDSPDVQLVFVIYGSSNEQLDKLVNGQKYRLHWIETVVNLELFGDDRYRHFVAYKIDAL